MKPPLNSVTELIYVQKIQPTNFIGTFTVIHKSGITKFDILDLAIKFFNELNDDAAVWDVTNGAELVKFKVVIEKINYIINDSEIHNHLRVI